MDSEDEPAEKPKGPAATEEEVREALKALDDELHQRLATAAKSILARHPRLTELGPRDLINLAAQRALEGRRKWYPEGIDFLGFVIGAMRSLASNATRIAAKTEIQTVSFEDLYLEGEDGDREFLENVPSESLTPEEQLVEAEDQARQDAALLVVRAQIVGDAAASAILDLLLDGLQKREIRAKLGMTDTEFWSADRKLTRIIERAARLENQNK